MIVKKVRTRSGFPTKIKIARLRAGLLQWDMAQKVGVTESYYAKIENGRIKPIEEKLKIIAQILNLKAEELFDEVEL